MVSFVEQVCQFQFISILLSDIFINFWRHFNAFCLASTSNCSISHRDFWYREKNL